MKVKNLFKNYLKNPQNHNVLDVTPEEVRQLKDQLHLIDVRTLNEFNGELKHIPGAQLITLDSLNKMLSELPKSEPIVFVCRSGQRSMKATLLALQNGFDLVYNLSGGMIKWNELGFEVE